MQAALQNLKVKTSLKFAKAEMNMLIAGVFERYMHITEENYVNICLLHDIQI